MIRNLLFVLIFLFSITLSAKQIIVTNSADFGIGSLREAVENAEPNDTIVFADSITGIALTQGILIEKNLTINGNTTENTIITSKGRHFTIPEANGNPVTFTLNNLTLKDGNWVRCGVSIYNRIGGNTLKVNHCKFINNSFGSGSGAIENNSNLFVDNCLFENSTSQYDAGAIFNASTDVATAIIKNSVFINNNIADKNSGTGTLYNHKKSTMVVTNILFIGDTGGRAGVLLNRGDATVINCLLTGNTSKSAVRGAIYSFKFMNYDPAKVSINIINTTITDNIGYSLLYLNFFLDGFIPKNTSMGSESLKWLFKKVRSV